MTVYIGIDWSQAKQDVCFLDAAGEPIARVLLPHLLPNPGTAWRLICQRITLCVPTDTGSVETTLDKMLVVIWHVLTEHAADR